MPIKGVTVDLAVQVLADRQAGKSLRVIARERGMTFYAVQKLCAGPGATSAADDDEGDPSVTPRPLEPGLSQVPSRSFRTLMESLDRTEWLSTTPKLSSTVEAAWADAALEWDRP